MSHPYAITCLIQSKCEIALSLWQDRSDKCLEQRVLRRVAQPPKQNPNQSEGEPHLKTHPARLLRERAKRPRRCCAAKKCDELAPPHLPAPRLRTKQRTGSN
jgi:hypothetical protein